VGAAFLKKVNIVTGAVSILADGAELYRAENTSNGDWVKFGVSTGLTVAALCIPGVNVIAGGIVLGLQISNSLGLFDKGYELFN